MIEGFPDDAVLAYHLSHKAAHAAAWREVVGEGVDAEIVVTVVGEADPDMTYGEIVLTFGRDDPREGPLGMSAAREAEPYMRMGVESGAVQALAWQGLLVMSLARLCAHEDGSDRVPTPDEVAGLLAGLGYRDDTDYGPAAPSPGASA